MPKNWAWALDNSETLENVNHQFNGLAPVSVHLICCSDSIIHSGEDKKNQSSIMGIAHQKNRLLYPESSTMKGHEYGLRVQILPLPLITQVTFEHDFTLSNLSIFAWEIVSQDTVCKELRSVPDTHFSSD